MKAFNLSTVIVLTMCWSLVRADESVQLANNPCLSPDGKTLYFDYRDDIWSVPTDGGVASRLTHSPGRDTHPICSPDGTKLAFISDRKDGNQVWVMGVAGDSPKQVTFHTAGYDVQGWYPDGMSILVSARRDHNWSHPERLFKVSADKRAPEELVFDDYASDACLSPDGSKILFCREGVRWWRKGYFGSQSSQVWLYDIKAKSFTKLLDPKEGAMSPVWKNDGTGFYYIGGQKSAWNVYEYAFGSKQTRQLTQFTDDGAVFPTLAKSANVLVYRQLFDLYRIDPTKNQSPAKIDIKIKGDYEQPTEHRRVLSSVSGASFTKDGLQIACVAGGDIWVMDTELRDPKRVTLTEDEERDVVFAPDGKSIYFVSDKAGRPDIYKAERTKPDQYWWQNDAFTITQITNDDADESNLDFNPDGTKLAFNKGSGDIVIMDVARREPQTLVKSFQRASFAWSPDGRWMAYSKPDGDFNYDVWVQPIDGSRPAFNVSRHPDIDGDPAWSPDGKLLAYVGRHDQTDTSDIFYVWLQKQDDDKSNQDRRIEKALDKMKKGATATPKAADPTATTPGAGTGAGPGAPTPGPGPGGPRRRRSGPEQFAYGDSAQDPAPKKKADPAPANPAQATKSAQTKSAGDGKLPEPAGIGQRPTKPKVVVNIDFDGIYERTRRISIPQSSESGLVFSPDSKKLAFTATVARQRGIYTVEIPENLQPTLLTATTVSDPTWLETGNQLVGVASGTPTAVIGSSANSYRFNAVQEFSIPRKAQAVFDLCWRVMRDTWYDDRLGNRDWNRIKAKYSPQALKSFDREGLVQLVQMMLGELNGSHLGFTLSSLTGVTQMPTMPTEPPGAPTPPTEEPPTASISTVHLGVRFDPAHQGPGLKVRDILPRGPADRKSLGLSAGDIITKINDKPVDPKTDLTTILNLLPRQTVKLTWTDSAGKTKSGSVEPTNYTAVRNLLYQKWMDDNRKLVDKLSDNQLGYLHIQAMAMPSFEKFEQELYAVASGKQGLIIDVRENGGGSTADHLLTALTQPRHAITIARNGSVGYPQDRLVYAVWNKPIVVMCNQNSFSNAEIFSHAVKTLKRGKVVGVPTAGGVVSTGARGIMDVGQIRTPFRGWYNVETGEDYELNGCVPDVVIWPQPGEMPAGKDVQLEKAIATLKQSVTEEAARPKPRLIRATERPAATQQ